MTKNIIGLDKSDSQTLSDSLNNLLANYQVFYTNVRGYHWNIKGPQFFELHTKFEEIYNELQTNIDDIAERILTLGAMPEHSFSHYLEIADIKEHTKATEARETVGGLVDGFSQLIAKQREILDIAGDANDEGTAALMSDYIRAQEKHIWMFNAWLQR
ncbi:DNA starvation/stationary phase protection protein [Vibrio sp.]|uniref:DNA starvation/stationary phase protection protein n=1 Tax=Vibrio viridaestus TaxID=2487322 RepID=A0A3N9TBE2_9VIBR|nr:Dps family protein [Vibrio viridaestus]MDC0611235.1 DNA starvation/stationary phase protection protein [Vibrio sp.]RQW61498.1 DNA starvation/stationary phase protection protein [Vibrio viridaestus]